MGLPGRPRSEGGLRTSRRNRRSESGWCLRKEHSCSRGADAKALGSGACLECSRISKEAPEAGAEPGLKGTPQPPVAPWEGSCPASRRLVKVVSCVVSVFPVVCHIVTGGTVVWVSESSLSGLDVFIDFVSIRAPSAPAHEHLTHVISSVPCGHPAGVSQSLSVLQRHI